ncbi:MAG: hypothetical protein ABW072_06810 [Sedimenticola sp.]
MSKKSFGRLIIGTLLIAILTGCASQVMKSYVGHTIADAIDEFGVPAASYDMPDGTRAFIWQETEVHVYGGASYASGYTSPVFSTTDTCVYTMYAEKEGDLDSPASWKIVGFKKPKLDCE